MAEEWSQPTLQLREIERPPVASRQARLIKLRVERQEAARFERIANRASKDRGVVTCGWCGTSIKVARVGRMPKWCSPACRHRAWEQRRAAESGLAAVEIVERPVEVIREVINTETVPVVVSPALLVCESAAHEQVSRRSIMKDDDLEPVCSIHQRWRELETQPTAHAGENGRLLKQV